MSGAARGAHAALTVVFAGALVAPLDTSVNVALIGRCRAVSER